MAPEVLLPAQSGEFIAKNAKYVKIHKTGLDKLCEEVSNKDNRHSTLY